MKIGDVYYHLITTTRRNRGIPFTALIKRSTTTTNRINITNLRITRSLSHVGQRNYATPVRVSKRRFGVQITYRGNHRRTLIFLQNGNTDKVSWTTTKTRHLNNVIGSFSLSNNTRPSIIRTPLLRHRQLFTRRTFTKTKNVRSSPIGRVNWPLARQPNILIKRRTTSASPTFRILYRRPYTDNRVFITPRRTTIT